MIAALLLMLLVFLRIKTMIHLVGLIRQIQLKPVLFIFISKCLEMESDVSSKGESDEDDEIFSSRFTARRKIASPKKSTHLLEFDETRLNKSPKASSTTFMSSPNKQPPLALSPEKEQRGRGRPKKAVDVPTNRTVVRESIPLPDSPTKPGKSKLGKIFKNSIIFLKLLITDFLKIIISEESPQNNGSKRCC